jgi:hypothetical protein
MLKLIRDPGPQKKDGLEWNPPWIQTGLDRLPIPWGKTTWPVQTL